jgi:hypothetical protein
MKLHRQSVSLAMLLLLCGALSVGCATEKVETDGQTVRLKESKCSLTFRSIDKLSEEEVRKLDVDFNPAKSYWQADFTHTGEHDLASIVFQPAKGGFAVDNAFVYTGQDGKKIEPIIANIGHSRAYLVTAEDSQPLSAAIEHRGYLLTYDFAGGAWSYKAVSEK